MEAYKSGTHDGDFCISLSDYADLRDIEVVSPNRRLNKSQIIKNKIEFDVYVENQHGLPVAFRDMLSQAEIISGIKVACPEHILILKQAALIDRKDSLKGKKDLQDMFKMLVVISEKGTTPEKVSGIDDELMNILSTDVLGVSKEITEKNHHAASILRSHAEKGLEMLAMARNPGLKP
jgi:hypothetical protein